MNPYGSFFVRAETGRYGESIDCLEGTIDFADTAIARSNLGRLSPTIRIPTPVAAGAPPTTQHGARRAPPAATRSRISRARRSRSSRPSPAPAPCRAPMAGVKPVGRPRVKTADREVEQARASRSAAPARPAPARSRRRPPVATASTAKLKKLDADEVGQVLGRGERHRHGVDRPDQGREGPAQEARRRSSVTITVTPASGAKFTRKSDVEDVSCQPDRGRGAVRRGPAGAAGHGLGRQHQPELVSVQLRLVLARHGRDHGRQPGLRGRGRGVVQSPSISAALPGVARAVRLQLPAPQGRLQRDPGPGVVRARAPPTPSRGRRSPAFDTVAGTEITAAGGTFVSATPIEYSVPALAPQTWTRARRAGAVPPGRVGVAAAAADRPGRAAAAAQGQPGHLRLARRGHHAHARLRARARSSRRAPSGSESTPAPFAGGRRARHVVPERAADDAACGWRWRMSARWPGRARGQTVRVRAGGLVPVDQRLPALAVRRRTADRGGQRAVVDASPPPSTAPAARAVLGGPALGPVTVRVGAGGTPIRVFAATAPARSSSPTTWPAAARLNAWSGLPTGALVRVRLGRPGGARRDHRRGRPGAGASVRVAVRAGDDRPAGAAR